MSFDMEDYILRHFRSLHDEEVKFTSGQSKTQSHLPSQSVEDQAQEIEEAFRISTQEAIERQKRKGKPIQVAPQEVGEPSTASAVPHKRKASSDTSTSSPMSEKGITVTTHSPLG